MGNLKKLFLALGVVFLLVMPLIIAETAVFTFDNIKIELFEKKINELVVGSKETARATLMNDGKCTIACRYNVQGTNYSYETITKGLSPGSSSAFNIIFFVPQDCREPCSITAHVVCEDRNCEKPATHETDIYFDLIGIRTKGNVLMGYIILLAIIVGIFFGIRKMRRKWKNKKEGIAEGKEDEGRRKLSAIMFTDMKGFSAEIGANEEKTLKKLWRYEKAMKAIIKEKEGRVVKTIGDAIMGDFDSAVNAVKAAIEIQKLLEKEDIKIRIGIHLGDVIHKGGDIFGDGVNIASRIESICEPGKIYISEDVYKQVRGKIDADFEDMGKKRLKNIETHVRAYKVK